MTYSLVLAHQWSSGFSLSEPVAGVVHPNHEGHCRRWSWSWRYGAWSWSVVATLRSVPSMVENLDCALFIVVSPICYWSWSWYAGAIMKALSGMTKNLQHWFYFLSFQECVFKSSSILLQSEWSCRKVAVRLTAISYAHQLYIQFP